MNSTILHLQPNASGVQDTDLFLVAQYIGGVWVFRKMTKAALAALIGGGSGGGLTRYRASVGGAPNYTPDWLNGNFHSIYSDTSGAAIVIFAPSNFAGGAENFGAELEICVEYANAGTIAFDSSIQQPAGFGWEFPVTVPGGGWRSHYIRLKYLAGQWCLVDFVGDFAESTD